MPKSSTSIARVTGLQVINILCVVGGVPGSQRETFPFVKTTRNQQTGPPIQLPSSLTSHNSIIWAVLLAVMRVPVVLFSPRTVFVPCLLAGWLPRWMAGVYRFLNLGISQNCWLKWLLTLPQSARPLLRLDIAWPRQANFLGGVEKLCHFFTLAPRFTTRTQ